MITAIFQKEQEFDRHEGRMRRTYLVIDDGEVLLADMTESNQVGSREIRESATCWLATGELSSMPISLIFRRGATVISLQVHLESSGIRIIDPKQDEWGGFGGLYMPRPPMQSA